MRAGRVRAERTPGGSWRLAADQFERHRARQDAAAALKAYDQARVERFRKDSFVGTGPDVVGRIEELRTRVGVDEMAVVTWTYDEEVRSASYTELARAAGLSPTV